MGRKVRKTLNIDVEKLKLSQQYLGLDTETEVIDRLLSDCAFEQELLQVLREATNNFKKFRSPLVRRLPPRLRRHR